MIAKARRLAGGMRQPYFRSESYTAQKSPGYLIRRLHNLVTPMAETLFADEELSFTQWITLMALRDSIADTPAGIARHLKHDPGATTRMIDGLERRALLTRTRCKDDRRVVRLALTSKGDAMARALTPRIVGLWNRIFAGFSKAEIDTAMSVLNRLVATLEAEEKRTQEETA
jgi:DNA-binding MarR family transcriptional regulator